LALDTPSPLNFDFWQQKWIQVCSFLRAAEWAYYDLNLRGIEFSVYTEHGFIRCIPIHTVYTRDGSYGVFV
jgi:hypothetical protein